MHLYGVMSHCPKLSHDNKQAFIKYVNKHVQAYLLSMGEDLKLHNLMKMYQKHNHSKAYCRKHDIFNSVGITEEQYYSALSECFTRF